MRAAAQGGRRPFAGGVVPIPVVLDRPEHRLCVGKEWHRFPSHFFLPDGVRVAFIKSDFAGLLPKYYEGPAPAGTSVVPTGMNDVNREDPSRYVAPATCDWIVDVCLPSQREPCWDRLDGANASLGTAAQAVLAALVLPRHVRSGLLRPRQPVRAVLSVRARARRDRAPAGPRQRTQQAPRTRHRRARVSSAGMNA